MEPVDVPVGGDLMWSQPNALTRYHELRSGRSVIATLRWDKMFGSLATGECGEGRFTFKRAGFLHPYVTVREESSDIDFARLVFSSGSVVRNAVAGLNGELEFMDGARFAFYRLSFWKSRWSFADQHGNVVVSFDRRTSPKPSAVVKVHAAFRQARHIDLLLVLGWYAIILDFEEAEAAVGSGLQAGGGEGP